MRGHQLLVMNHHNAGHRLVRYDLVPQKEEIFVVTNVSMALALSAHTLRVQLGA